MKILVLEDNSERQKQFNKWNLQGHEVTIVETVGEAISELEEHQFDMLSLDHDLGDDVYVDSVGKEETGYLVALWLVDNLERKPKSIVLHSLNVVGRVNMKSVLSDAYVIPFVWELNIKKFFIKGSK